MTSSAPTVLTLETNSAWIMILAVSVVTLVAAFVMRRVLARPGGMYSSLLLALPLALPLLAAVVYQSGVLPEISVLQPWGQGLLDRSESLLKLIRLTDGSGTSTVYALAGSPGTWLIVIGVSTSSFMLIRRVVGIVLVRRLERRCRRLNDPDVEEVVATLSARVGLREVPQVLLLPPGLAGAFATGLKPGRILVSEDLIEELESDELEGIMAHEIAHLYSRDVAVICGAGFLRDLVAWNPVAHVAFRRLCVDREYEADRRAAALTGAPLSVASGLLKAIELTKRRRGFAQRAVLAAVRPGALVSRRVNGLIAVADGRTSAAPSGFLPFVAAGLLVALLGLSVGARLAGQEASLLIAWGEPTSDAEVWTAPKDPPARGGAAKKPRGQRAAHGADLTRPVRLLGMAQGVRILDADLNLWTSIVGKRVKRSGLPTVTLRWEARRQYQAVPIITKYRLPIGIYRLEREV